MNLRFRSWSRQVRKLARAKVKVQEEGRDVMVPLLTVSRTWLRTWACEDVKVR